MHYYLLAFLFLFNSCQDNLELKYEEALKHQENKEYRESNILLYDIISSPDSPESLKIQSYFLLAQTFYDLKNYKEAIESYKNILEASLDNPIRKKTLFMIAYIYYNDLDMYTHSVKYYNIFKEEYPEDELIPAVDYELEQINDIIKEAQNNQ